MIHPWLAAARPRTLFASACPVIAGASVAAREGPLSWPWLAATLACALLLQITANYANDYWDWRKGADTSRRRGPARMTATGTVSPRAMLAATLASLGLALALGAALVARGGWPIAVLGLAAAASAILYTAGPFALAYLGLGELFAFVFFGPVAAAGTAYLQELRWSAEAAIAGLAPGGYAAALMAVNNLRDRDEDARADKRTLAVRLGPRGAEAVFLAAAWLPVAASTMLLAFRPGVVAALPALAAVVGALQLTRALGPAVAAGRENSLLSTTGTAALVFTATFALAWPVS